ncbi:MAG: polysaccharide deacetylase family protein [Betaproteobacteria bacterium]
MDGVSWARLEEEIGRRGGAAFWWRDDDAALPTAALERLLAFEVPIALAVVPLAVVPELFQVLPARVSVLQHGTDHRNRAGPGEKKTEFPAAEPDARALERLAAASQRLRKMAGERALPVLVPPWNRIRETLVASLPRIGFAGLSQDGKAKPVQGLKQVNTHIDIVAWHAGRRFIGEAQALAAALELMDVASPLGWLTHHAVHDEAAWRFLERLVRLEGVRWANAPELFSYTAAGHG